MNEKKFERVSPRPIGPKKMSKNWFAGNVFFFPLWLFFSVVLSFAFLFFIFWGWTNSSRDSQGLISRPKKN